LKDGSAQHLYIRNQILFTKMEEAVSSETLLNIFQTAGCHIRCGSNCHSVLRGSMKHLQTKGRFAFVSCICGQ